jgi:hypothetical protein
MYMDQSIVFVITATVGTDQLLDNLKSVQKQDYPHIEHVVVVDGKQYTEKVTELIASLGPQKVPITQINIPWNTGRDKFNGHKIYASISHLIHKPALVSFLDEDNFVESNHISSMVGSLVKENCLWGFCLRNIVEQSGKFVCRDMCESLGTLSPTWIGQNDHLIDMSCYIISVDILQMFSHSLQRPARSNPEVDRLLFRNLNHHFKKSACSMKYTMNYRVDSRGDSVTGGFFVEGNKRMNAVYNNSIPWNDTSTL